MGAARGTSGLRERCCPRDRTPLPVAARALGLQKRLVSLASAAVFPKLGGSWREGVPGSGPIGVASAATLARSKSGQGARRGRPRGDGWRRARCGEGDLWGQGAALSIGPAK